MAVGNLHGADLDGMDTLRSTLDKKADAISQMTRLITTDVHALDRLWHGPDSAQFRRDWNTTHRKALAAAANQLQSAAETVERNRMAQDSTSALDSKEGPVGGGTTGGAEGRTDLDDPELAGQKIDRPFWFDGFEHDDLTYEWLPADEYGLFGKPGSEADPALTDITQGQLGDCWFLAGLGAAAHNDPDLIEQNIQDNGDGTYTVTFYEKSGDGTFKEVEVTVDGSMPSNESGPNYAQPSDDGATWAMIYEKAYADYAGGYDDIEGGSSINALELITGESYERQNPNDLNDAELVAALQERPADIGMINPDTNDPSEQDTKDIQNFKDLNLYHSHQYVVQEITQADDGEWMVQLYNPHGVDGLQPDPITLDEFRSVSDELNTPTP